MDIQPTQQQKQSTQTPPRDPRREIAEKGGMGAKPFPSKPQNIINLEGFIQTVTTIPTEAPKTFYDSQKIYTDSLSSPTVRRLYIYSVDLSDWLYVALST